MKKMTYFLFFLLANIACSNKVTVKAGKYKWKNHGSITDQTIDLNSYKSPNEREGQSKDRLVIVCASGGGARASAFTIGSLLELETILMDSKAAKKNEQDNVANEIDYFSTVSGGGWGAGSYIAYKYQNIQYVQKYKITNPFPTFNSFEEYLAHWADRRYARYQLQYFLGFRPTTSGDVIMDRLNAGYLGWVYRAIVEEDLWNKDPANTVNGKLKPFDQDKVDEIILGDVFTLAGDPKKPKLPMLIPNCTNIDNYMLVPFSPDRLNFWGVRQYRYTTKNGAVVKPAILSSALSQSDLLEVPLAAGIKASSSVNSFIGASSFPSTRSGINYFLHLEDGGVLDNLGLHTAKAILRQEDKITDSKKRIVIIIDASSSGITNHKKMNKKNAGRIYSSARLSPPVVPDIQYPLSRERIQSLESEYNCTVIYLGNEVLLDENLGLKGTLIDHVENKKDAEAGFYKAYKSILNDRNYFNSTYTLKERSILYTYIEDNLSTWFSAKKSVNDGLVLVPADQTEGYAKVMFLAGRGIVQLKKDEIIQKLGAK